MDWSIQEISKRAGITSRTLRHYDDVGLLKPARIGGNGYRYYDAAALVRLQRILLLRDLGLGLGSIAEALDNHVDSTIALHNHLSWLRQEQERLTQQVASVEDTISRLEGGEQPMVEKMFNGFDHAQYKGEVEERWGKDAYARSNAWWSGKTDAEKEAFHAHAAKLGSDWTAAAEEGISADSDEAQALAQRQFEWLAGVPGLATQGNGPSMDYFVGIGEMYVADPRFGANYGGPAGAGFVRDAMKIYAERRL